MKGKILLLFCLLLSLSSCTERYYDGSERYVVQGILLKEGQPLQHELVFIDTYLNDYNVQTASQYKTYFERAQYIQLSVGFNF